MPSGLREQVSFAPSAAASTQTSYPKSSPPQKKQKMTITQTYYLAHTARGKLSSEAARGDHDLRLLVGHANLLDTLMVELQDAEREQEAWFNQTVRKANKVEGNGRVQWQDTIYEESVELPDASDSDSESDEEADFEEPQPIIPLRRLRSPPAARPLFEEDYEEEYDDEDEDNHELALVRTQSHPVEPEPELVHDSGESDDESPPNSPPSALLNFTSQGIKSHDFASQKTPQTSTISTTEISANDQDYFIESSPMIAVCC